MNKYILILLTSAIVFANSCSDGQNKTQGDQKSYILSPNEFSEKIKELPNAPIIDVRTPGEFANGHIENAININWKSNDFENQISKLDKTQAVLVYCLSGARSSAAASKMRSLGFVEVYELNGGMMKWRAANLFETTATTNTSTSKEMSKQDFDNLLNTDKMVLFDFYASWCGPCQKMKPFLEEISKEMAGKIKVISIDVDANKNLSKELKVDVLPTLFLYKNKTLTWTNTGYISKENILQHLK
jgi:thioredoxin 1